MQSYKKEVSSIKKIVSKREPGLLPLTSKLGVTRLEQNEREALREAIASELIDTGLNDNDEPNKRGLMLESLIDLLGSL